MRCTYSLCIWCEHTITNIYKVFPFPLMDIMIHIDIIWYWTNLNGDNILAISHSSTFFESYSSENLVLIVSPTVLDDCAWSTDLLVWVNDDGLSLCPEETDDFSGESVCSLCPGPKGRSARPDSGSNVYDQCLWTIISAPERLCPGSD